MSDEQKDLVTEVVSGDHLRALNALLRYVIHELEGNRCHACEMSKLRTGDTAALVLRAQKLIEEITALQPDEVDEGGGLSLAEILNRRDSPRISNPAVDDDSQLGTKAAPRRQGGRRPSVRSD